MLLILLIVVIVLLLGGGGYYMGPRYGFGPAHYGGFGLVGIVLICLILWLLLIPSMAGTPTGNVGALGGVALNYDSTNKKLCVTIGATVECTAAMTP